MKIPTPGSIADKVGHYLHENEGADYRTLRNAVQDKGHSMTASISVIREMVEERQIIDHKGTFLLCDRLRKHYDYCNKPVEPYVGEVVQPRDSSLNSKPWTGRFSFTNAPRREPIRDISFKTAGQAFIPWYEVA